ncbi:hypothetical protein S2M10_31500 [Sphingomonas sp. S2M10]|nr:hypothetical protein [Sphingomonas sp. S2M10]
MIANTAEELSAVLALIFGRKARFGRARRADRTPIYTPS